MRKLTKPLAVGLLSTALTSGVALATPLSVTWDPGATTPALNGSSFTQNNQFIADYGTATVNAKTGAFTDSGYLVITQFNSGAGATGVGSNYSLFYTYNASGRSAGSIARAVCQKTPRRLSNPLSRGCNWPWLSFSCEGWRGRKPVRFKIRVGL